MSTIKKIGSVLERTCMVIAAVLLVFICIAIAGQVLVRKLGGTLVWVDELTRYAFVCLVLFGTVSAARTNGHISITSFLDMVPSGARKIIDVIIYIVITVESIILTYAYVYAIGNYEGVTFSVVKQITMSQYYILVAVLMILITLASILHIVDLVGSIIRPEGGADK